MTDSTLTTFLWFDGNAGDAAAFYDALFVDATIDNVQHLGNDTVLMVHMTIRGQKFTLLNGGPQYDFTPAVSFMIHCHDQAEVDYYWGQLIAGGTPFQCGWVSDRFGVTWQVVPDGLFEYLGDPDPRVAEAATQTMLGQVKLDLSEIAAAAAAARNDQPRR